MGSPSARRPTMPCSKKSGLKKYVSSTRIVQFGVVCACVLLLLNFLDRGGSRLSVCGSGNLPEAMPLNEQPKYRGPPATVHDKFTLILNSFHKQELMKKSIQHYAHCSIIDTIRVVWCEDGEPPVPEEGSRFFSPLKDVRFDKMPDTSLNNRFRPVEGLKTEAVFSIDDDIYMPCSELEKAFKSWKERRRQLVGFYPRVHIFQPDCSYRYLQEGGTMYQGAYSVILTKAALFHRDYLEMYTNYMPKEIWDYVSDHHNCEDIALQFLVANMTHEAPEFVNALQIRDLGKGALRVKGISHGAKHLETRTGCLNDMTEFYGGVIPLQLRPLSDHGSLLWIRIAPLISALWCYIPWNCGP